MGLQGMIGEMMMRCDKDLTGFGPSKLDVIQGHSDASWRAMSQLITTIENDKVNLTLAGELIATASTKKIAVLGITGTVGAGKSSLTDELIRRFRLDLDDSLRIAVISIDPSRRKTGGALLGDRIRMNAISPWNTTIKSATDSGQRVFMRSLALCLPLAWWYRA